MKQNAQKGQASLHFCHPVFIQSSASIVGKKEGEGPLGLFFDRVCHDPSFGANTWEEAESTLQKETAILAIEKAGIAPSDIRMIFAGDLLAQSIATSFGIASLGLPFFGLYGACSTMGEALALGAMSIAGGYADRILCATSSHFASAEKEFRFPLGYGNQRPFSATWTVTGSGACVISSVPPICPSAETSSPLRKGNLCVGITGITVGKIIDYGFKDSLNMGGCMAPAACDTIFQHLKDFHRQPQEYDAIVTGDLGVVGHTILLDLLKEKGIELGSLHLDCGMMIFDHATQDTHAGGSGCGCAASVLASYLLPKLLSGEWKRILFVPTGALLSKVSFNEGDSVPGIAHGIVLEQIQEEKEGF